VILIREFASADEEMKKITLKVVKQCVATDGVEPEYIRAEVWPSCDRKRVQPRTPLYHWVERPYQLADVWARRQQMPRTVGSSDHTGPVSIRLRLPFR